MPSIINTNYSIVNNQLAFVKSYPTAATKFVTDRRWRCTVCAQSVSKQQGIVSNLYTVYLMNKANFEKQPKLQVFD